VFGHEGVQFLFQKRAILADGHGDLTVFIDRDILVHPHVLVDLEPDLRFVIVDNDGGQETDVGHLHQVFILQILRRLAQLHRRPARRVQLLVQSLKMREVTT